MAKGTQGDPFVFYQDQPSGATGTITSSSSVVSIATCQGYGSLTVSISGVYNGVNVSFEGSDDAGVTWYPIQAVRSDSFVAEITSGALTNTNRIWDLPALGITDFRVKATAWVSGTANIRITRFAATVDPSPTVGGTVTANLGTLGGASTEATLALIKAKTDNIDVLLSSRTKPADTQPVSGTFWQTTQPVSIASLPALTDKAGNANNNVIGNVSLGNSQGKTNVLKTGSLTTTAATADQVILTYTVTAGKTFYLEYVNVIARLTTYAATATLFGSFSLETPSGTKVYTSDLFHAGATTPTMIQFPEPIPIAAGVVVRLVCTPSGTTSFAWKGNFGGFEK